MPGIGGATVATGLAAASVLLHAFAMAVTLQSVRKGPGNGTRWASFLPVLLFLGVGPGLVSFAVRSASLTWYGVTFDTADFLLASTVVFSAWAVFGAYRVMCVELQVRTTPLAWCAFTLFLSAYVAGFPGAQAGAGIGVFSYLCVSGLAVSIALSYVMLFSEQNSAMGLRRVLLRAGKSQWLRVFEEMPCWPATVVLAFIFAAGTIANSVLHRHSMEFLNQLMLMPLVFAFLLARDAAIVLFFAFSRQAKRVEAAALIYMAVLYWLLPGLLRIGGMEAAADFVLPLFIAPATGSVIACVQAAIAIFLCVARWRKNYGVAAG
jgi:hypothetical protein